MKLKYIPRQELETILTLPLPAEEKVALFADACRLNTLYMIMRAGSGHIGSSFSAMDLVVWLHLQELRIAGEGHAPDVYFSSKGHDAPGLYSVMLGLGLLDFDLIHQLRRLGGLPGHPDVGTPGIPCNTGSLGMGIAKGKGMIHAGRLDGKTRRVFVLTGDGELQEGQNWESLQGAANRHMGELTVIVDHNKIQSDTWVEKVSPLGDLEAKFKAFGWEVARCDGHDLATVGSIFKRFAAITDRPKILIADTIKGRGVSFMEQTSAAGEFEFYKFHSGAPSTDNFAAASDELLAKVEKRLGRAAQTIEVELPDRQPPRGQRLVGAYSNALLEEAAKNPKLVALDADLMLDTGLIPFAEKYPERFIECGIAEQDMVSQAGGFALQGFLPICHSFACFLSTRPNEQIFNNATEHTKIIYVGSLAGVVPGGPGHSHQSVRDISCLAGVPGLVMVEPSCESEVPSVMSYLCREHQGSAYVRLVSIPVDIPFSLPADYQVSPGRGCVLREGSDVVVIAAGPVLLSEAWKAADLLAGRGVSMRLINLPWLNEVDASWLREVVGTVSKLVCLENHFPVGGQADRLASVSAENGEGWKLNRMSVDRIPECGLNPEVLAAHGLDAASLADRIAILD